MAIMYPKNIDLYNPVMSEKLVYRALQEQLPDTYSVYYSLQWVDNDNGKRHESECDFLIYNENEGFLTCEVKGGIGYKKENDKFILIEKDEERILKRSPMEQAEESSRYFYKLYAEEYNETFNGVYGSFSLFPLYEVNDPILLDHRTKDIVLDVSDMDNLANRIKQIFIFYKGKYNTYGSLTRNQRKCFRNLINKEIATMAVAGAIIKQKEYELDIVNRIQDNLIYFLKNYNKTFITGGAGTGKTWIAYKFAKKAALEGKSVLLTAKNGRLIRFFKTLLSGYKNIEILSYNDMIIKDGCNCINDSKKEYEEYSKITNQLYDCIVVDEAQDFDQYEAFIISMHLGKSRNAEMRIFYDKTQNVYDQDFMDGFDISLPPYILRENLRNTESIYEWAQNKTDLGKEVITNQIIGPTPIEHKFAKKYDLKKYLESEILKLVDKESVKIDSIVLLLDHDNYNDFLGLELGKWICYEYDDTLVDSLRITLVEDFKGLESDIIFYVHNYNTPEKYNYVAYTRAKYYLYNLILK